jgi:uncharacterized protein with von Willebrand factor type A (vWA) domain
MATAGLTATAQGDGRDLAAMAGRFGWLLHAAGVPVTPERSARFAAAVALAEPVLVRDLYWVGRVTLLTGRAEIEIFDRVFAQVFAGAADPAEWRGQEPVGRATSERDRTGDRHPRSHPGPGGHGANRPVVASLADATTSVTPLPSGAGPESLLAAASPEERLRSRDFESLTDVELAQLRALIRQLALVPPTRPSRRSRRHRSGPDLDLRSTLRRAQRRGGDPADPVRRRRRPKPRRLVLVCDVSGSMEAYSRAYLQLLTSAVWGAHAEAFVFATRLTRLTRALRVTNPDLALERAARAAPDWSGGTRIGEAMKAFNDGHGRRGVARGAVVVIISDGWETGDAALLEREMGRLHRLAYQVIWINPRLARESYQPLTAGIVAAGPYVDRFLSGHSLDAMVDVVEAIASARRDRRR